MAERAMNGPAAEAPEMKNAGIPRGTLLPSLELESLADGRKISLRGGRGPRVIHLSHAGGCEACASYMRELSASAASLAEWGARLVEVVGDAEAPATGDAEPSREGPEGEGERSENASGRADVSAAAEGQENGNANVLVLADPEGRLAARLGLRGAALIIADEWGEIYFAAMAGARHGLPESDEVVEWARFVSIQCPECEQPEGDWRTVG